MGGEIKRFVTGHDSAGSSVILMEDIDANLQVIPKSGIVRRVVWVSNESPADISRDADPVTGKEGIGPSPSGSIFQIVDFPPFVPGTMKDGHIQELVGDEARASSSAPTHPMVHRTRTLDYALVLSGEIDMLLSNSVIHCKPGDVVVQQGTVHGWVNKGTTPCRVAFIMIDALEPPAWGLSAA